MAVSRAPKRPPASPAIPEDQVQDVIRRGGTVAADLTAPVQVKETSPMDELKNVQLRVYESTLGEIDRLRRSASKGRRPVSRHAWLLDAIEEKLERERRRQR
jgi:hypothetical protein